MGEDLGGPVVQFEVAKTEKYKTDRWIQVAVIHVLPFDLDVGQFPSIFVRLDDPEVLQWIYQKVFPDRVEEDKDYFYWLFIHFQLSIIAMYEEFESFNHFGKISRIFTEKN